MSTCLPGVEAKLKPYVNALVNHRFFPKGRFQEKIDDWIFANSSSLHSWKHCATNFDNIEMFSGILVLFTVRHPASWVLSLFRRPYHQLGGRSKDLSTFIERRWKTVERERLGGQTLRPLELYQCKLESYRQFSSKLNVNNIPYHFVRFEDLVLDQKRVFDAVKSYLDNPTNQFVELRESTKEPGKTLEDYRSYYGEERWRDSLGGLEHRINEQIDWSALKEFRYEPL